MRLREATEMRNVLTGPAGELVEKPRRENPPNPKAAGCASNLVQRNRPRSCVERAEDSVAVREEYAAQGSTKMRDSSRIADVITRYSETRPDGETGAEMLGRFMNRKKRIERDSVEDRELFANAAGSVKQEPKLIQPRQRNESEKDAVLPGRKPNSPGESEERPKVKAGRVPHFSDHTRRESVRMNSTLMRYEHAGHDGFDACNPLHQWSDDFKRSQSVPPRQRWNPVTNQGNSQEPLANLANETRRRVEEHSCDAASVAGMTSCDKSERASTMAFRPPRSASCKALDSSAMAEVTRYDAWNNTGKDRDSRLANDRNFAHLCGAMERASAAQFQEATALRGREKMSTGVSASLTWVN